MARGRRPLPWIKLWFDILGDPKMTRLSGAEKWCWVGILLLAGQSPIRGKLMLTDTTPMTINDIARALNLHPYEIRHLKNLISKMIELKSLRWVALRDKTAQTSEAHVQNIGETFGQHSINFQGTSPPPLGNEVLEVVNFQKRQEVYPSDLADAAPNSELTPKKLPNNSEKTPKKLEKEGEGRGEKKDLVTTLPVGKVGGNKKPPDPRVREIFDEIRKFFGYPEATNNRDPIPNHAKEGQFIKKMLSRGFTRDDILSCWRAKVQQRRGEFVSMVWVNEDIGDFVRRGEALPASPKEGQNQAMTTSERRQYEQREPEGRGAPAHKSDSLQDYVERSRKAGLTVIVSGEEANEGNEDGGM